MFEEEEEEEDEGGGKAFIYHKFIIEHYQH